MVECTNIVPMEISSDFCNKCEVDIMINDIRVNRSYLGQVGHPLKSNTKLINVCFHFRNRLVDVVIITW